MRGREELRGGSEWREVSRGEDIYRECRGEQVYKMKTNMIRVI